MASCDALGFAAGESRGEAVERQVFEANVVQEFQALVDFGQDFAGYALFFRGEVRRRVLEEAAPRLRRCCIRRYSRQWRALKAFGCGRASRTLSASLRRRAAMAIGAAGVAAVTAEQDADVDLVFFRFEVVEVLADAIKLRYAAPSRSRFCSVSERSQNGISKRTRPAAFLRKSSSHSSPLGLVQGSMAPSSMERPRLGTTRSME